jgi:hypothetical protein
MYYSSYISNQTSLMIVENQGLPSAGSNATGIFLAGESLGQRRRVYIDCQKESPGVVTRYLLVTVSKCGRKVNTLLLL